ncbi:MAG: hypothetical protein O3B13_14255, partial [Planctomycetota bacterium]|nr:hypothetical protein [Planctomycetota bacterium]
LGVMLGNSEDNLWAMRNGYALVTAEGLNSIAERLSDASESERDTLRQALRIGLHWNTSGVVPQSMFMPTAPPTGLKTPDVTNDTA